MHPFLRSGRDSVELTPIESKPLKRGEIILFRYHGQFILHRIIRIDGDRVTARGDALKGTGESFGRRDVVAKVTEIYRGERRKKLWHNLNDMLDYVAYKIHAKLLQKN